MITDRAKGFDYGTCTIAATAQASPLLTRKLNSDDTGLYSEFASPDDLQKYAVSEAHVKVVNENVKPNVEGASIPILLRRLAILRFLGGGFWTCNYREEADG